MKYDKETQKRLLELSSVSRAKNNNKHRNSKYQIYLKIKKPFMMILKIITCIAIAIIFCRVVFWICYEIAIMLA